MIELFPQELISKYIAAEKESGTLRNTFMWDGTNVWFNVELQQSQENDVDFHKFTTCKWYYK